MRPRLVGVILAVVGGGRVQRRLPAAAFHHNGCAFFKSVFNPFGSRAENGYGHISNFVFPFAGGIIKIPAVNGDVKAANCLTFLCHSVIGVAC